MGFTGRPDKGQDLPQLLLCPGPDMRKTTILLLVVTAIAIDLAAGKFCPKERKRDKCKAKTNQYKCGVFYKNMVKRKRLSYIGALPDDLTEKNRPQWKKILGPTASRESFDRFNCGDGQEKTRANSRCYSIMNRLAKNDFDTCDDSLLNHRGRQGQTPGDKVCDQLFRFLSKTKEKCLGERNTEPGADVSIFLLRRHLGHGQQQR